MRAHASALSSRHPASCFVRVKVSNDQAETARRLYACGYDTADIAKTIVVPEAQVFNIVFARGRG